MINFKGGILQISACPILDANVHLQRFPLKNTLKNHKQIIGDIYFFKKQIFFS